MAATTLTPGSVIGGDFVIERALSEGGMGAVYVCMQTSTGKRRALKVMLPELMAHPSLRERFVQEAKVAAKIDSEHIVEVVAAGLEPVPWLAMELLDGQDLAKHVDQNGPVSFEMARAILEQACHALGAAHLSGVVHRDLKPENIFLGRSRQIGGAFKVKILDFGIAKIIEEASTKAGKNTAAIGTRPWMAPEQAQVGQRIGPPTDVWALGLIAFFLVTGKSYWLAMSDPNANEMMLVMEVCVSGALDKASERAAALGVLAPLPAGFDAWFARCVVRDPASRFRDAREAFEALASVGAMALPDGAPDPLAKTDRAMVPLATIPAGPAIPLLGNATKKKSPLRRAPVIGAGVGLVVLLLATYGALRRTSEGAQITGSAAPSAAPPPSGATTPTATQVDALPLPTMDQLLYFFWDHPLPTAVDAAYERVSLSEVPACSALSKLPYRVVESPGNHDNVMFLPPAEILPTATFVNPNDADYRRLMYATDRLVYQNRDAHHPDIKQQAARLVLCRKGPELYVTDRTDPANGL